MGRVQAELDIAEGRLGIARDRLRECLRRDPANLEIRALLADVNWKLGYPIEAGRWWFFDEHPDEQKLEAIARFMKSCSSDPVLIMKRLRLPSADAFPEKRVAERVRELEEACRALGKEPPTLLQTEIGEAGAVKNLLEEVGCFLVTLLFLAVLGYGMFSLVRDLIIR